MVELWCADPFPPRPLVCIGLITLGYYSHKYTHALNFGGATSANRQERQAFLFGGLGLSDEDRALTKS